MQTSAETTCRTEKSNHRRIPSATGGPFGRLDPKSRGAYISITTLEGIGFKSQHDPHPHLCEFRLNPDHSPRIFSKDIDVFARREGHRTVHRLGPGSPEETVSEGHLENRCDLSPRTNTTA